MEYRNQFLREIEAIKPYLVEFEFEEDDYLEDYAVGGLNWRPIIFIIYDESTFNANQGYYSF